MRISKNCSTPPKMLKGEFECKICETPVYIQIFRIYHAQNSKLALGSLTDQQISLCPSWMMSFIMTGVNFWTLKGFGHLIKQENNSIFLWKMGHYSCWDCFQKRGVPFWIIMISELSWGWLWWMSNVKNCIKSLYDLLVLLQLCIKYDLLRTFPKFMLNFQWTSWWLGQFLWSKYSLWAKEKMLFDLLAAIKTHALYAHQICGNSHGARAYSGIT